MEINKSSLINYFHSLKAWQGKDDFTEDNWQKFIEVAKIVQLSDPDIVQASLEEFIDQAVKLDENYQGFENESKVFILLRIVFDIPEKSSSLNSFSYKGWTNWPLPDANGNINLAWPISWQGGHPKLVSSYEGSMGQPYAAGLEYRFLKENFPFRKLQ